MIMQITGPVVPPPSFLSTLPSSSTFAAMPSADVTFHIPNMRRVISSPSKHTMQLRDAAQSYLTPAARSLSHTTHDSAEELLPAFLRDEYFTRQAMKQMAEHRVLLDARKKPPQREAPEDDEYAWYLKNPQRYIWRPRAPRTPGARSRMVLHGELGEARDEEVNRSLFASYLIRHYGSAPVLDTEDRKGGTRPGSVHAAHDVAALDARGSGGWGGEADESEGSTVFWIDEWDRDSSPTVGNSLLHVKCSGASSIDNMGSPSRSAASEHPPPAAQPASNAKNSKKRWSSKSTPSSGKDTSSRRNSTHARAGSLRRFSLFRLFSS